LEKIWPENITETKILKYDENEKKNTSFTPLTLQKVSARSSFFEKGILLTKPFQASQS